MDRSDSWLRRHALQLAGQPPDDYAEGVEVLKHMREIWDHLHQGAGNVVQGATVLTLHKRVEP